MIKRAYAKLNLSLNILRRQENGYHDLKMVMVPITLYDQLQFDKTTGDIEIQSTYARMPINEKNIIYQAFKLMKDRYQFNGGLSVHIRKMIPIQAGLAGGSSDAAVTLLAINELWKLGLSRSKLAEIGKELGADVPFCIYQQSAIVEGIGERLVHFDNHLDCEILLVKPRRGISTKRAFSNVELESLDFDEIQFNDLLKGLRENDYDLVCQSMHNDLEQSAVSLVEEIKVVKEELEALGFDGVLMTGSGSTVFGLTQSKERLDQGYHYFRSKGYYSFRCRFYKED